MRRPEPEPEIQVRCPNCAFVHNDKRFRNCRECGCPL